MSDKEEAKDSDYLLCVDRGMSPRTLQEYLAPRISVNLQKANGKIDNIALAAEPELLMGRKPRSKTTDKKSKRKNHRVEKI